MNDYSSQYALVTGAASGIGRACAFMLADMGYQHLLLVDIQADALAQTCAELPCNSSSFCGDVGDAQFWQDMDIADMPVTAAVISAGISLAAPIAEMQADDWRKLMHTNLDGAFFALQKAMQNQLAHQCPASNVLISSISGQKAEAATAAYGCSKAAINQLVRVAAKEGAAHKIRVNALAPAGVDTPIWDKADFFQQMVRDLGSREKAVQALEAHAPLGRWASAEEIAAQARFLLCEAAATITGQIIVSDGGYSL